MSQKKKKRQNVNKDKFNFDDEYIIGFSNSATVTKKKKNDNKQKKNKKNKKNSSVKNKNVAPARTKMYEKRNKFRLKVFKIFLVIAIFVGAGCFLCLSPTFNVQEITVEKNNIIASDTIISLSEIKLYKNIFLVDKLKAVEKIEKEPYIDSVKISRVLPNKIKIVVKERVEKYLIEFAEGKYAVLDGQGYILKITNDAMNLPVVVGVKTELNSIVENSDSPKRLCEEDLKKLDIVANIVQTAKNYEVDSFITKIDIGDINNVRLELATEEKIAYLGSCSDLNTRILYMKDIINREKGIKGEIFINGNLSEDRVFFRESVN